MGPSTHGRITDLGVAIQGDLRALGLLEDAKNEELVVRLAQYLSLLLRWGQVHNLTAIRDLQSMRTHHLADCLAVVPSLRRHFGEHACIEVMDVGAGAGLPSVVLAALNPAWTIWAVDAAAKKVAFLRQASAELSLPNLRPVHARVEDAKAPLPAQVDLIIARAVATLSDLVTLSRSRMRSTGSWAAMKGKLPQGELSQLPADVEHAGTEVLRVPGVDADRCLIWMHLNR
jgi:16S rRNA (guanine527-N7)-methyltransferase